jgi:hypothetical protein
VLQVPDPEVFIQTLPRKSENIGMAQLLAAHGLIAKLVDFIFDVQFKVTSFSVYAMVSGKEESAVQNEGSRFTTEQRSLMRKVKRGDAVHFKDIKVMGSDSLERYIAPITVKIK